ncbi:MAG: hypothetical protein HPY76_07755 [Anaerolineae bacterium]|jgi:hypothetical protein|nr:hypothetical protein [Anaerolineae bacterium]
MTKARSFLFAVIFLAFMTLGILLYADIRSRQEKSEPAELPSPTVISAQKNYFILRVDDLQKASPSLMSVWVTLVFPSDYSTLIFKSLYPQPAATETVSQVYKMRLDADGNPAPEFWDYFNQLPLQRNGFVLVDNVGLQRVSDYITGATTTFLALPDDPALRNEMILTEEHLLWQETCLGIQSKSSQRGAAILWSDLIPNHLRTDIGFADIMMLWDKLARQTDTLHCEILITP